jgi:hypothetical protein
MSTKDIRWIQHPKHFLKAFGQLKEAVELSRQRPLSRLEQQVFDECIGLWLGRR